MTKIRSTTTVFFSLILPTAILGQGISEPECFNWTQAQVFAPNPNFASTEDAYIEMAAGTLNSNCIDRETNEPKSCDIYLGQSDRGDNYTRDCTKNGGKMWVYDFSPRCIDSSDTKSWLRNILVCASSNCTSVGVQNLIPHSGLFAPYVARNYSCGSVSTNLKEASSSLGSPSTATGCFVVTLLMGAATMFFG